MPRCGSLVRVDSTVVIAVSSGMTVFSSVPVAEISSDHLVTVVCQTD